MEKTYKILKLLIWVLAFAVVIVGAYVLYNRLSAQMEPGGIATVAQETAAAETVENAASETEAQGSEAPDFTVYDLEGNAHKLSDFRGKPVLLNFWASWCGPCQMEMPDFQKFYESHGDKVNFVIVNLTDGQQETVETASAFIAEKGYTFPVYYDTDIDAAAKYGVNAVPVSYFIDEEGYFVAWAQGALSADMLQQGMDLILG
jgi:thiol-disulfide isomerase/thioredoxin